MNLPDISSADAINEAHRQATRCADEAISRAIECGRLLLERKADLLHGEWMPWVEANCDFSLRAANRYMKAAKFASTSNLTDELRSKISREVWGNKPKQDAQAKQSSGAEPPSAKATADDKPDEGGGPEVPPESAPQTVDAADAMRPTVEPPSQNDIDLQKFQAVAEQINTWSKTPEYFFETFGSEAIGEEGKRACQWMSDLSRLLNGVEPISIPLKSGFFQPTEQDIDTWREAFPGVDIESKLRWIAGWNHSNPDKRKTAKGIRRHIFYMLGQPQRDNRFNNGAEDSSEERAVML